MSAVVWEDQQYNMPELASYNHIVRCIEKKNNENAHNARTGHYLVVRIFSSIKNDMLPTTRHTYTATDCCLVKCFGY